MTDIFLHIPKTGGTTLGFPLRKLYGYWSTLQVDQNQPDEQPSPYASLSEDEKKTYRLLKGHCFFGLHEWCPDATTYFTLLREPAGRVASMYRMMKKEWSEYGIANTSLREFVEKDHPASRSNMMTAYVSGLSSEVVKREPAYALQKAKENLDDHIAVAGITERYDESIILMKRRLGWDKYPYYVTSRVGKRRDGEQKRNTSPDAGTQRLIERENELDVRLYEHARNRFETAVANEGDDFQQEVETFRDGNQLYEPLMRWPLWLYRQGRRAVYKWRGGS